MKIREIYELAIKMGIDNDPRGREYVEKSLVKQKEKYEKLSDKDKEFYPTDLLENPYADSRLLNATGDEEVNGLIVGVDMEAQEVVLADRLREKGLPIDMVLAHHPEGVALVGLADVMNLQKQYYADAGVPINASEDIMAARIARVRRNLMSSNFQRAVDAARLLDMPMMNVHTPCDNLVHQFLTSYFAENKPETVGDIIDSLMEIPEYRMASELMDGPKILVGKKDNSCGVISLAMTGGTGTSKDMYLELARAGVGTIVAMHMTEESRKEAEKNHLNVVIAGHMASDSVGINLFLDELADRGVAITPASGLLRVDRRNK